MISGILLSRLHALRFVAATVCTTLIGLQSALAVAAEIPGVLRQEAMQSVKAQRSVLLSVARAGERLVAVGERGIIVISDDSGKSWRQAKVPVSVSLTAVQFVDAEHGWAVGHLGVVLHTDDGGETWAKQLDGIRAAEIALHYAKNGTDFVDQDRAIKDAEWLIADGPDKPFLDVYFFDRANGFIVGAYNLFFKTADGGKTWSAWSHHIANPSNFHLNGITASKDYLYIVGERGLFFRSADKGLTFQPLSSPYEGSFFGAVTAASGELVVFGLRGNAFWSDDGGMNWSRVNINTDSAISAGIALANGSLIMVSQVGELFANTPGARRFEKLAWRGAGSIADITETATGEFSLVGLQGLERASITLPSVKR